MYVFSTVKILQIQGLYCTLENNTISVKGKGDSQRFVVSLGHKPILINMQSY